MNKASSKKFLTAFTTSTTLAFVQVSQAYAQASQAFQPIDTAATTILGAMTGTTAKTIATACLAAVGILGWLTGHVRWGWLGALILGCVFTFGGKQLINAFASFG